MKIIVRAKPSAREDSVKSIDAHTYEVSVIAPPIGGKANAAIVKLLAEHFHVAPSLVEILSGHMARVKVVEIHRD